MQFSDIIIEILDANNKVYIPTIGELFYNNSKLVLDPNASGTGLDLVNQVAKRLNLSTEDAEKYVTQEVNNIKEDGIYTLGNKGDITIQNGLITFNEAKQNLFPSDFFGGTTNLNVSKPKDRIIEVSDEVPEIDEKAADIIEETPDLENEVPPIEYFDEYTEETTKKLEEEEPIIEETIESAPVEDDVTEMIQDIEEVTTAQEELNSEPETEVDEVIVSGDIEEDDAREMIEDIEMASMQQEEMNSSDYIENDEVIDEPEDEGEEFIEKIEEVSDYQEDYNENHSGLSLSDINLRDDDDLFLDESNMSEYDKGYYDYLLKKETSLSGKWNTVIMMAFSLLVLAVMVPWVWASINGNKFLGMEPLWGSSSKKVVEKDIVSPPIVAADSTKIDSNNTMAQAAEEMKNNNTTPTSEVLANNNAPAPKTTSSSSRITKPSSGSGNVSPTRSTSNNTNNTLSVGNVTKSTVTASEYKRPPIDKNVKGRPYATANYVKGNHYVSFGAFSVPKNAQRLNKDLNKLGIITDIVLVDGLYKVVIPYTSKEHAAMAAAEYPNTSTFD